MADRTRSKQRQQRSDARDKRRSLTAKPFEELDEAAGAEERETGEGSTVKKAVATALAGVVAAGVAGAAKALADRRSEDETPAEPDEPEESEDPENRQAADDDDVEPQAADASPTADAETDEADEAESDHEEPPADEHRAGGGDDDDEEEDDEPGAADGRRQQGATADELKELVDTAKRELEQLLGKETERVSGFHRARGGWAVTLEVVEVHRIPETTDVLSSYEVAFDDDRNIVGVSELRRYRRSQIEEH